MILLELIGAITTLIGAIFLLLSAIGLVRMPDFYNRVQAGTKASTLGVILSLLGLGLIRVEWLPKIALIILFVMLTNPLSSHALARAVFRLGLPMAGRDGRLEGQGDPTEHPACERLEER